MASEVSHKVRCVRRVLLAAVMGLSALALSAEVPLVPAYTEPVLEISVASDTTLSQWLSDNEKTLDGVKTIVKKGAGKLTSDSDISGVFNGDIVIETGVFSVTVPKAFGGDDGAIYVLKDAQYLVDVADGYSESTFVLDGKPIVIAGTGPSGDGAIRHMAKRYLTKALGDIYLADDALFVCVSWSGDLNYGKSIHCNGHVLREKTDARLNFTGDTVVYGPGTFENVAGYWGRSNAKFTNGVEVIVRRAQFWGSNGYSADSTLHFADNAIVQLAGSTKLDTRYNRWDGPIRLDGRVTLTKYESTGGFAVDESVVLAGKVSGSGPIASAGPLDNGCDTMTHVRLMNGANDFTGGVVKIGGSVDVYADGALPRDGGALVLSNSTVVLYNDLAWHLPELRVCGTGRIQTSTAGGVSIADPANPAFFYGDWKKIVKDGAGELTVESTYGTEMLDVREGTVVLEKYERSGANMYGPAGLIAGFHTFDTKAEMEAAYASEELYPSGIVNRVTISDTMPNNIDGFNYQQPPNSLWTYSGYIWNRTGETRTWTFLLKQNSPARLFLDGAKILEQVGETPEIAKIDVTPGAHRIVFRMASSSGWVGTAATKTTWGYRDRGFSIDYDGGDAPEIVGGYHDFSHYTRPEDDGTGSLFTLTDDVTVQKREQAEFQSLRGCANAALDANDMDHEVATLIGYPEIRNGGLTVTSGYQLEAAMDIGCASVDGTLTFADGCTFSVDDTEALRKKFRAAGKAFPYVIAEADEIVGCPSSTDGQWALRVDAEGKKLLLEYRPRGLVLIFR